ncbi:hypothetical protein K0M31_016778 [Melipona bicolor]|uniref:E3 ubiquitin-protein ligase listerin n=1 Tax=Melipona bicolor TaxID=60889 RepID=A0AA40FEB6_9HYME|nr:hypothetical protein K0M31_016778 [Melipona bicolor]
MGKNKQAQRVKNNGMPSNSGRRAKFLDTPIDFSTVRSGRYVAALPLCDINEVEMNRLDSNVRIILKKMNKKNPITKYKVTNSYLFCSFIEMILRLNQTKVSFLIFCRPYMNLLLYAEIQKYQLWKECYHSGHGCIALAIDIKRTVREAAQLAHAALVKRIGKSVAKYLKLLAGAWFISQYDVYPPAASIATNSFNVNISNLLITIIYQFIKNVF